MSDSYKIAFLADSHAGYAAKCRNHTRSGLNYRVLDGYKALEETITQAIEESVDLVLHGGDLFHRSWPSITDIVWVRQQLNRLVTAGIPAYINTGNHDAAAERGKSAATAAVHDPDRGIYCITNPYSRLEPVEGLIIHTISHYGLARAERIIPEPEDGSVNILTAHGAAMVPGHEIFHCVDSPGEQPIGLDLLTDDRFDVTLLGHYHGMGEIMPNVWYAGSSIRRGFSDPAGGRGWLLASVAADGSVTVSPRYISQRAQHDLPKIDAAGLTGPDVEDRIRYNLSTVDLEDAIVRQVVTNCSAAIRRGVDQSSLHNETKNTLMWMPDFRRPAAAGTPQDRTVESVGQSLRTSAASDLPRMYEGWFDGYSERIPEEFHPHVREEGARLLKAVSEDVETGDHTFDPETETDVVPSAAAPAAPATPETDGDPEKSR